MSYWTGYLDSDLAFLKKRDIFVTQAFPQVKNFVNFQKKFLIMQFLGILKLGNVFLFKSCPLCLESLPKRFQAMY